MGNGLAAAPLLIFCLCFPLLRCRILPDFKVEKLRKEHGAIMGLRFRKSIKIAPGVKINLGKKSVGMSIGGKYGGMSFNSKSGSRVRASIPGTGLSYSSKLGGGKKGAARRKAKSTTAKPASSQPVCLRWWYILLIILFAVSGIKNLTADTGTAIVSIVIAAIMGWFTLKTARGTESAELSNSISPTSSGNKEDLLELQKIVVENSPDELICSESQLKALANEKAENSYRIMNDCSNILQETTDPEVFFEKLQLFITHCDTLVALEKYISFSGVSPTDLQNTLIREKQDVIKEFLVRYFNKVLDKADNLKTPKGKSNQYQKFYDSLKPYFAEMDADNIDYIETKYKTYTRLLESQVKK